MCYLRHAPASERCTLSTCAGDSASTTCPRDQCSPSNRLVCVRLGCNDPMLQHVLYAPGPSYKDDSLNSYWEPGAPNRVRLRTPQGTGLHVTPCPAAWSRHWVAAIKSLAHCRISARVVLATLCLDLRAAFSVGAAIPAQGLQVPWIHAQVVMISVCCTCSPHWTDNGRLMLPTTGATGALLPADTAVV